MTPTHAPSLVRGLLLMVVTSRFNVFLLGNAANTQSGSWGAEQHIVNRFVQVIEGSLKASALAGRVGGDRTVWRRVYQWETIFAKFYEDLHGCVGINYKLGL